MINKNNLKAPINDNQAATGILGIRPNTINAHLVRAVLESIAFRVAQLYLCTTKETNMKFSTIRYFNIYLFNENISPNNNKLVSYLESTVEFQKMILFANY